MGGDVYVVGDDDDDLHDDHDGHDDDDDQGVLSRNNYS